MTDINAAMTTATGQMIDAIGLNATYTPAGGVAATIKVLFDNEYELIGLLGGAVSSTGPAAQCKTSDVSSAKKGDALTVSGVNYSVTEVKPDGTGMTVLMLRKA